jgi:hypothetical protein
MALSALRNIWTSKPTRGGSGCGGRRSRIYGFEGGLLTTTLE